MVPENNQERKYGVKAVIISTENGIPLATVKIDKNLNENLIAPFFSALQGFSDESLGAMSESLVQSGNLDMLIKKKHGLILIAIMNKDMKKVQIGLEAEQALDLIFELYKEQIEKINRNITIDLKIFKEFEELLEKQIHTRLLF